LELIGQPANRVNAAKPTVISVRES